MNKFALAVALSASLLSGCVSSQQPSEEYVLAAQQNQMVERHQASFDHVIERSHVRQQGSQKVFIAELGFKEVEIDEGFKTRHLLREQWQLKQKDIAGFQALFAEAMTLHFSVEKGFQMVEDPEHADIIIVADMNKISPNAPKDDFRSREMGVRYFTEGSGSMTIAIDVYKNNKLVMKIEDSRDAGKIWERNTRLTNRKNTRHLFGQWAKNLVEVI